MKSTTVTFLLAVATGTCLGQQPKELLVPSVFSDHMVLQRDQPVRFWGWDKPGQEVSVLVVLDQNGVEGNIRGVKAGDDGRWEVTLPEHPAGGPYNVEIRGSSSKQYKDVLFGEVWVCSGQSNMAWPVSNANHSELEIAGANFSNIRLISVPQVGLQAPQKNFKGEWTRCSPETVKNFSAVGYFFGRQLHSTLNVPIGLIDNAWGGSACEAWINRDLLTKDGRFEKPMGRWEQMEANVDSAQAAYEKRLADWKTKAQAARKAGNPQPPGRPRRSPKQNMTGNQRPANIYNLSLIHI